MSITPLAPMSLFIEPRKKLFHRIQQSPYHPFQKWFQK
jgi:hypothetical protein